MIIFPEKLIQVAPASPYNGFLRFPNRPWWITWETGRSKFETDRTWHRIRDGAELSFRELGSASKLHRTVYPPAAGDLAKIDPLAGDNATDLMAEFDRRWPLAHPGFRAGQVWGDIHGNTVALLAVDWSGRLLASVDATNRPLQLREFQHLSSYPFLLADPCCPHLAPWSPS